MGESLFAFGEGEEVGREAQPREPQRPIIVSRFGYLFCRFRSIDPEGVAISPSQGKQVGVWEVSTKHRGGPGGARAAPIIAVQV
jgi:hypothetical protein